MSVQPIPSAKAQAALNSLNQTMAKVLDKKWRLGQYAVISVDNKPVIIEGEALKTMAEKALNQLSDRSA